MPVSGAPGNFPIRIEPKFLVMKMSAIEEIGPIGVQVGRQAAPGEIAEINNNYKRAKHNLQSTTLIFIVIVSMTYVNTIWLQLQKMKILF